MAHTCVPGFPESGVTPRRMRVACGCSAGALPTRSTEAGVGLHLTSLHPPGSVHWVGVTCLPQAKDGSRDTIKGLLFPSWVARQSLYCALPKVLPPPDLQGFPAPGNSLRTPASCPAVQLDPATVCWEMPSDSSGIVLSPTGTPSLYSPLASLGCQPGC